MEDVRDYIWVAPLIAGILTLISFFTPAFYASQMGISEYNWMWGLSHVSISGYGSRTFFIPLEEPMQYTLPIFLTGIFTAIFILIGSIGFIAMANSIRKGIKKAKDSANAWIGMGILMIVGAIIYIIGIDITMMNYAEYQYLLLYPPPAILPPFWSVYNPGFAIIAPFLGAGISIVAGIASKIMKPREVILPMKKEFLKPVEEFTTPSESKPFKFCPNCGHKIFAQEQRFCTNCGYSLKGIPMTQYP